MHGLKVGEVGSVEHARLHGESHLNTFRDGFRVLRTILSEYGRAYSRGTPGAPVERRRSTRVAVGR